MAEPEILLVDNLTKTYRNGQHRLTVLDHVSFSLVTGSTSAIVGPSGSGKTTLLSLCAGLDNPSSGSVILNGIEIGNLNEDERASIRNQFVGFVFQAFQLIPTLTALENVMVPLELNGKKDAANLATDLLGQVGLGDRLHHYPTQLSGGEQQRVALARAFINRPRILFCDEPTGNLDSDTGEKITELIFELNKAFNTTLVLVTHDLELANKTQRILSLKGGRVETDEEVNISG
ncbi:MAG: ABC transporter ATP-binding protein [Balneolales bacterium]